MAREWQGFFVASLAVSALFLYFGPTKREVERKLNRKDITKMPRKHSRTSSKKERDRQQAIIEQIRNGQQTFPFFFEIAPSYTLSHFSSRRTAKTPRLRPMSEPEGEKRNDNDQKEASPRKI